MLLRRFFTLAYHLTSTSYHSAVAGVFRVELVRFYKLQWGKGVHACLSPRPFLFSHSFFSTQAFLSRASLDTSENGRTAAIYTTLYSAKNKVVFDLEEERRGEIIILKIELSRMMFIWKSEKETDYCRVWKWRQEAPSFVYDIPAVNFTRHERIFEEMEWVASTSPRPLRRASHMSFRGAFSLGAFMDGCGNLTSLAEASITLKCCFDAYNTISIVVGRNNFWWNRTRDWPGARWTPWTCASFPQHRCHPSWWSHPSSRRRCPRQPWLRVRYQAC